MIYLQQPIAYYEEVKQESLHKPEPMWDSRPLKAKSVKKVIY